MQAVTIRRLICTCQLPQPIRHASKSALKSKLKGEAVPRPVAPPKLDRPPPAQTASGSAGIAIEPAGVPERLEYAYKGDKLPDPRVVYAAGLVLFAMCLNSADILRRTPKQVPGAKPDDSWPAWKRYSIAAVILGAGSAIAAYAVYWPLRIVKRIDLLAPSGALIPPHPLHRAGHPQNLTTYHQSMVRLTTLASESVPRLFRPRTVPFANIRLLGPLSESPKWYHPQSTAFESSKKRRGKFPPSIPFMLQKGDSKERGYNLRRDNAAFTDLEGLEQALLANSTAVKEDGKAMSAR